MNDGPAKSSAEWVFDSEQGYARSYWREVFAKSSMLKIFYTKIILKQYQRTVLGKIWLLIRPMTVMLPYFIVGKLLAVPSGKTPYLLVVITGFSIWTLFARAWFWGTRAIDQARSLLYRVRFPLIYLPIVGQGAAFVEFTVYTVFLFGAYVYFVYVADIIPPSLEWKSLTAILCLVMALLLSLGLSMFTAIGNIVGRDMRFTLRYVLQFWVLATPVAYPLSALPASLRPYAEWNPMTPIVETYRTALLNPDQIDFASLIYPASVTALVLALGLYTFSSLDSRLIMKDWL